MVWVDFPWRHFVLLQLALSVVQSEDQLSVDDIVAKAIDNGYRNLKFERTCANTDDQELPKDEDKLFTFIRKQKAFEEKTSNAGRLFIEVNKELVKLSGKNIHQLVRSKAYRESFARQFCRRTSLRCSNFVNSPYRSADGRCNNVLYPTLGSRGSIQSRYLPPQYEDGITEPRSKSGTGKPLLNPRIISNEMFRGLGATEVTPKDNKLSLMTFTWGQFTDHDIVLTPVSTNENGDELDCCGKDAKYLDCLPISIPASDQHFRGRQRCMTFSRSMPAESFDGCAPGHREQVNRLTSFIDAGNVYGDSLSSHALLNAPNGCLNTTQNNLLPPGGVCKILTNDRDHCPRAGDERVSENPSLGGMHVIWVRQHNQIAQHLTNTTAWSSFKVFQETRKIIGAMMQRITYGEYLPKILSPKTMTRCSLYLKKSGYETQYDQEIDPSVKNVFAAAAFRFGHSQIPPELGYLFKDMTRRTFKLEDTLMDPHLVVTEEGAYLSDLVRFVLQNSSRLVDRHIEPAVRNTLFVDFKGRSFDLGALNIQRGRDHGLPPYTAWRKHCALFVPTSFEQLVDHDVQTREKLSNVYELVTDIDVFTGGISELPEEGSILGPLFNCLIGKQFRDLRLGDRYWFENPGVGGFTPGQLQAIRGVTLASVICNALDIGEIQKDAFEIPHEGNPLVPCKGIPKLDLAAWKT